MKLVSTLIALMTAAAMPSAACAGAINYQHLEEQGFGDVGRLLQSMTPEQRAAVLEQAALKEKDLQKLTPAQLAQLKKQLRDIASTMDIDKIDPAKLDIAKAKSAAETRKDLTTYQKRYDQGKIDNGVVKPKTQIQVGR